MNNTSINYGTEIVSNLEKKGESANYIVGFLQATLNGLQRLENKEALEYLKRSVEHSKQ